MPINKPIKKTGHIRILYGNLASNGSVAKITGKKVSILKAPLKFLIQKLKLTML